MAPAATRLMNTTGGFAQPLRTKPKGQSHTCRSRREIGDGAEVSKAQGSEPLKVSKASKSLACGLEDLVSWSPCHREPRASLWDPC
ncbi:hypothetical protein CRG98_017955 [Punica granatum]|uniref:Uncharacterized protein n=1 Tax=Punica granatum TaxID=22663 RepID=A0A2I0K0Q2_PUNGR|nr:hypothetical protein CRG98_017955 [Punica granatum]